MFVGGLRNDMSAVPLSKTEEVAKGLIEAISIRLGISEGLARGNAPFKGNLIVVLDPFTDKPFELGKIVFKRVRARVLGLTDSEGTLRPFPRASTTTLVCLQTAGS